MCTRLTHWLATIAAVLQVAVWLVALAMALWILTLLG